MKASGVNFSPHDGVWHWQTEPRAICKNNIIFYSYITSEGSPVVASYNEETGNKESYILKKKWMVDDHPTPSILIRKPDKRIMVFFARNSDIYYYISTNPMSVNSFGEERIIETNKGSTYAHAVQLSDGCIYLISRDMVKGKRVPVLRISKNGGSCWTERVVITRESDWLYPKAIRGKNDSIHLIITGNPAHAVSNVWYIKIKNEKYIKADGTIRGDFGDILNMNDFDIIHNNSLTGIPARAPDLSYDDNNYPCLVYVLYKGKNKKEHEFRYCRWNGHKWLNNYITTTVPISDQPDVGWVYFGGICLKKGEPDLIAFSKKTGDNFQIHRGKTGDYGLNWKFYRLTYNKKNDCIRPWYINGYSKEKLIYLKGKIIKFNNYDTEVNFIRYPGASKLPL